MSSSYFDKYLFESDPVFLDAVAAHLAELLPPSTEVLAGLELATCGWVSLFNDDRLQGAHGRFDHRARRRSVQARLATHRPWLLAAAVTAVAARARRSGRRR